MSSLEPAQPSSHLEKFGAVTKLKLPRGFWESIDNEINFMLGKVACTKQEEKLAVHCFKKREENLTV